MGAYQWFLRNGPIANLNNAVSTHACHVQLPCELSIGDPCHVGVTEPWLVLEAIRRVYLTAELIGILIYATMSLEVHHEYDIVCSPVSVTTEVACW